MDTSDPARREDSDARPRREVERRGDGRGAPASPRRDGPEVLEAHLCDVVARRQLGELRLAEPDPRLARNDGDGCGLGARLPNSALAGASVLQVPGPWEAVGDDGRFECYAHRGC